MYPDAICLTSLSFVRLCEHVARAASQRLTNLVQGFQVEKRYFTQESALKLEISNGSRIQVCPGREATVRGFSGVSTLIVDEAARVEDQLYQAVRPMIAVSGGRIILLSTPFGSRGFFWQE